MIFQGEAVRSAVGKTNFLFEEVAQHPNHINISQYWPKAEILYPWVAMQSPVSPFV